MKFSIVIPTYNHCDDLLKPCIESIFDNTDLTDTEVIVVANGCVDNTKEYLLSISDKITLVWSDDALGYPKAINLGVKVSKGHYVVLMNNDTVLLPQEKNKWLDIMHKPFISSHQTGITGPVKFYWDCKGNQYDCMAFWLVMIKRELFDKIGLLDEIFSPGMGEDADFCIKAVQNGYSLVAVPNNVKNEFGEGISDFSFPIYHVGNGTFSDDHSYKDSIIERNNKILHERYGRNVEISIIIPTYNHFDDALKPCIDAVLAYTDLSNKEVIVVANGCDDGKTREYLDSLSDKISYIWFDEPTGVVVAYNAGIDRAVGEYIVLLDNDSILLPQSTDDWINILKSPFLSDPKVGGSSPFANEYEDMGLALHSGCTMYKAQLLRDIGKFDEIYNPGYFCDPDVAMKIWKAGYKCIEVPEYNSNKRYDNGIFSINFPVAHMGTVQTMDKHKDIEIVKRNREILYSRYGKKNMKKFSIIIPTYNHCDDLLKPCIESIIQYSDINDIEIIVSANGCTDNTREYVNGLGDLCKLVWTDDAIGYTKAVNRGIEVSSGEYIVLLNNDTELLPQEKNTWLNMMADVFKDEKVGLTGPLQLHDDYADADVIIFFCAMTKKSMFDELGLLDEIYTPGGGEDIDFSVRVRNAGYKVVETSSAAYNPESATNVGNVPIWHKDNRTFKDIPEYSGYIIKRNGLINCKRYNKNIKLNLGSGGLVFPGYLSVDLHDKRADILMDIEKLDFDDNSVSEILASHVFEHLNPFRAIDILKNWNRVLKPGGKLIMEMPDLEKLCERFATASTGDRYWIASAIYGSVNTTSEGGEDKITSPHLFGWWPQSIHDHLANSGFVDIKIMDEQIPHPQSNFRVEATKPL